MDWSRFYLAVFIKKLNGNKNASMTLWCDFTFYVPWFVAK